MRNFPEAWYTREGEIRAMLCRKGELVEVTEASPEKIQAGRCALDTYAARAVALDPDVTYCCIQYSDKENAERYINNLRSHIYHRRHSVFVGQRGCKLYVVKAVDFDG